MSATAHVAMALHRLGEKLGELQLLEEADAMTLLVSQQRWILEDYVRATPSSEIDYQLLRGVFSETTRLMEKARLAHAEVAVELDSLSLGRNAVSAYGGDA